MLKQISRLDSEPIRSKCLHNKLWRQMIFFDAVVNFKKCEVTLDSDWN